MNFQFGNYILLMILISLGCFYYIGCFHIIYEKSSLSCVLSGGFSVLIDLVILKIILVIFQSTSRLLARKFKYAR